MNNGKAVQSILIVDDTPSNINLLLDTLTNQEYKVLVARDGESAIEQARVAKPNLILLDVMMPGIDGFETCRRLKEIPESASIPIIFMTALTDVTDKVKGFNFGAVDYITKPFQNAEVIARVNTHLSIMKLRQELSESNKNLEVKVNERTFELSKALEELNVLKNKLEAENLYLKDEIKVNHNFDEIIGESKTIRKVLSKIEQVAPTDATVLLLGETGTGKELVARAIHNLSLRKDKPLVKVNCAALPSNLIESELFGHEKGSFTGAVNRKIGRFELADGGTIFLDEIGEMPIELQPKLLRVLQEGEFERIGDNKTLKVNVRVIAATNKDLQKSIEKLEFRQDLYYRLNVFPITIPSLRERREDIPLLINYFVSVFKKKLGKTVTSLPDNSLTKLINYSWPGNVREMENVIERAMIISQNDILEVDDFLLDKNPSPGITSHSKKLEDIEKEHILTVLKEKKWIIEGKNGAAVLLGLKPSTLRTRMQKLGISRPQLV